MRVWWPWEEELAATSTTRLAGPPAPVGRAAAALIVATIGLYAGAGALAGGFDRMPWWAVAALWLLVLTAGRLRQAQPLHVALLCALAALASVTRGFGIHPFPLLGALCAYGLLVLASPRLREAVAWTHSGLWGPGTLRLSLLTAFLPLVGMPLWRVLAAPDVDRAIDYVAGIPVWVLPAVGIFFALVNAVVEEIAFRGVLLDALWSAVGLRAALVLQAVAFGLVHLDGLPNGPWGAGLAGCYGLLLGLIRVRARGMVAPCVAHIGADLVIFAWLVAWAR